MPQFAAIETAYAGCRFRSRTEARWAVFFDHLGVNWQYEVQGYRLHSGPYLPDFLLPGIGDGSWFEVKGGYEVKDDLRWEELATESGRVLYLARELPRVVDGALAYSEDGNWAHMAMCEPGPAWDEPYDFCICPKCGRVGVEFDGTYSGRICGHPGVDEQEAGHHPRVIAAYAAANSARFEHGETPRAVN